VKITVKRLESGYFYVLGTGMYDLSQVPHWPCDESVIRSCAMTHSSEEFLAAAGKLARDKAPDTKGE